MAKLPVLAAPPRRVIVGGLLVSLAPFSHAKPSLASSDDSLWRAQVGPASDASPGATTSPSFASLTEAISSAAKDAFPAGRAAVITLGKGMWRERVVVPSGAKLTIEASEPGSATVTWETKQPYESVMVVEQGARLELRGVRIRHASKSVANNYAVFLQAGDLTLVDCDVSSSTGAGISAEGGMLRLIGGIVHDCARQGLTLFGPLMGGEPLIAEVRGTLLRDNGNDPGDFDAIRGPFDGVIARNGVEAIFQDVVVEGSGSYGIAVFEDARIEFRGGALRKNRKGESNTRYGGELVFPPAVAAEGGASR